MAGATRYALDEAAASLWRGWRAGILSTATIAVALFVLGGFLIATANLERLGDQWNRTAEMSVFLKDDISAGDRGAVEQAVAPGPAIAAREFVSKADALARFKQTFSSAATAIDPGDNPLPASFEVRLTPDARDVDSLAATLRGMPGVADVQFDRQWLARMSSAIRAVRGVGFVLGTLLTVAAGLTVANVVRLALHARRDELDIMQLVGAPDAYVRGPFVVEGILQGGLGAVLALIALAVAFATVRSSYLAPLATAVNLSSVQFLRWELCGLLVLGGMAVGCLGGLVAAWRS